MKIIGVGGRDRSGKDTVSDLLIEHGYFGYSFGDAVRRYAMKRHPNAPDPISVKNMTETSNWLRGEFGADVILREALEAFEAEKAKGKTYKGIVLYSVRAPIEVDYILAHGGEIVWIETSDEVRHARKIANMRPGEASVTLEQMLSQEALQEAPQPGMPPEVQMDLPYIRSHATMVIENSGNDFEAFKRNAEKALNLK